MMSRVQSQTGSPELPEFNPRFRLELAQSSPSEAGRKQTAPAPVISATGLVLFPSRPPAARGEDYSYLVLPRSSPILDGRLGRVTSDSGKLEAYVAEEAEIASVAAGYRDASRGLTREAFINGIIANEVSGKKAKLAWPAMPADALEVVSETVSAKVAGPNWAFRTLMSVQGEQEAQDAGGPSTNYRLLLGLVQRALGEAVAEMGVGGGAPEQTGARLTSGFFAFAKRPDTFSRFSSFPDVLRGFAVDQLGLTPAQAEQFAGRYASAADRGFTRAAANFVKAYSP